MDSCLVEFWESFKDQLFYFIKARVSNQGDAEDLLQDIDKELKEDGASADNFNKEIGEYLKTVIFELPNKYQEALLLYEFENLKHKEIAEKLQISVSGSKTRVQRAREMVKLMVAQCCNFEFDAYGNIIDVHSKCTTCES